MARLVPARRVREGENAAADATRRVETASFMAGEGGGGRMNNAMKDEADEQ